MGRLAKSKRRGSGRAPLPKDATLLPGRPISGPLRRAKDFGQGRCGDDRWGISPRPTGPRGSTLGAVER
jgi:hypothetical protein